MYYDLSRTAHVRAVCRWLGPGTLLHHPNRHAWPRLLRDMDDIEELPETQCEDDAPRTACPVGVFEALNFWSGVFQYCDQVKYGTKEPLPLSERHKYFCFAERLPEGSVSLLRRKLAEADRAYSKRTANLN